MSALLQMTIATDEMTDNPRAPAVPRFNPPLSVIAPALQLQLQHQNSFKNSQDSLQTELPKHRIMLHFTMFHTLRPLSFSDSQQAMMSLNPPKMSLQLKSSNAVSPPDFSRQALSVKPNRVISEPQMLSRFQIFRQRNGRQALYLGTHQDDPMLPVITPNFRFPAVTLSLNPPKMSLQLKTSNAVQISDSSKGMAGKVRLETHQDDPMLNVLQISDCRKSISLNSSTLCVPALKKISNAAKSSRFQPASSVS